MNKLILIFFLTIFLIRVQAQKGEVNFNLTAFDENDNVLDNVKVTFMGEKFSSNPKEYKISGSTLVTVPEKDLETKIKIRFYKPNYTTFDTIVRKVDAKENGCTIIATLNSINNVSSIGSETKAKVFTIELYRVDKKNDDISPKMKSDIENLAGYKIEVFPSGSKNIYVVGRDPDIKRIHALKEKIAKSKKGMMSFQELKVMQLDKEPKTGSTQVVPITYKVQIASKKTKMDDSEFYNHRNKCKCELMCEEEEGNWRYYLETVFEDYKEAVNARDEISLYFQKPFVVVCDSKGRRI